MDCWSIFWTTKTPWCADSVRHIDAGLPTAFGRGYTTRQLKETQGSAQEADEDIKANGGEGSAGMEGKQIFEAQDQSTDNADEPVDTEVYAGLSAKEKKLFDLRLKLVRGGGGSLFCSVDVVVLHSIVVLFFLLW